MSEQQEKKTFSLLPGPLLTGYITGNLVSHANADAEKKKKKDADNQEYAESRANAMKVGAKIAPTPKEFSLHVSEAEYQKLVDNQSDDKPAPTKADSKPTGGKMSTVDSTSWLDRADQVAWEGVKNVTGTKDNPKKQVFFSETEAQQFQDANGYFTKREARIDGGSRTGDPPGPTDALEVITESHGASHLNGSKLPIGPSIDGAKQEAMKRQQEGRVEAGQVIFAEDMQKSRDSAMKVGAKIAPTPKEFFDPVSALVAGAVALPVAYGVGKATDYVYDAATQSDADWQAKHGGGATSTPTKLKATG